MRFFDVAKLSFFTDIKYK